MTKKIKGDTVKWGIIGVGDVCEVKSAPAMQLIEHSELVAVMRRNTAKAKDYAQRHQVPKWYDQASDLINDPDVNAIYIATPPNAHAELTKLAAKAGKPVYVEKPMAKSLAECEQMIAVCKKANVPLYVAYYRRSLPNFTFLRHLVRSGEIGDIRLVKIELYKTPKPDIIANSIDSMSENWRVNPDIAGGGYFFDLASHQFDYLDFVFGPIQSVSGAAGNQAGLYAAADIVTSQFTFENGVQGIGSWCFTVDKKSEKDELTIMGTEGQLVISFFGVPEIRVEKSVFGKDTRKHVFTLPKHIQQPLIQTIVNGLLGKGTCLSTGESAARTNWVMEEITKGYYKK
ncbi:MAG: Gfo/Idh/MocA family oxidoreductase [Bacteroidota bacterium]